MQKDSSRVSHELGVSMNKWHKLKCHSKETDFKWSSSCWETNVHWTFWFLDGPNWTKKDLCQHYVENCTFVESHSFKHHQKECLCPVNQMNNHREHAWLFSIFTTTTLPLGWPIRQGQQFNLAWETFILWPFSFVFLKCFDDRS